MKNTALHLKIEKMSITHIIWKSNTDSNITFLKRHFRTFNWKINNNIVTVISDFQGYCKDSI